MYELNFVILDVINLESNWIHCLNLLFHKYIILRNVLRIIFILFNPVYWSLWKGKRMASYYNFPSEATLDKLIRVKENKRYS